jgi:hypothetical protein
LCGGVVGLETVVAETKREQIHRAAEGGVCAASVGGGDEHTALGGSVLEDLVEFPGLNQRNVGRDDERAVCAAFDADLCRHFDGTGFSGIRWVGDDTEFIITRQVSCVRIAGDDGDMSAILSLSILLMIPPLMQCGENVVQHGLRELSARRLIQNVSKALLG